MRRQFVVLSVVLIILLAGCGPVSKAQTRDLGLDSLEGLTAAWSEFAQANHLPTEYEDRPQTPGSDSAFLRVFEFDGDRCYMDWLYMKPDDVIMITFTANKAPGAEYGDQIMKSAGFLMRTLAPKFKDKDWEAVYDKLGLTQANGIFFAGLAAPNQRLESQITKGGIRFTTDASMTRFIMTIQDQ